MSSLSGFLRVAERNRELPHLHGLLRDVAESLVSSTPHRGSRTSRSSWVVVWPQSPFQTWRRGEDTGVTQEARADVWRCREGHRFPKPTTFSQAHHTFLKPTTFFSSPPHGQPRETESPGHHGKKALPKSPSCPSDLPFGSDYDLRASRGHPWSQGPTVSASNSGCSHRRTHSGKTMARPDEVSEATGVRHDSIMSSSWGTCHREAKTWQDVLSTGEELHVVRAQRWQDILLMDEAPSVGGAQKWEDVIIMDKALNIGGT